MSDEDVLLRAARALRDEPPAHDAERFTRARIMASVHRHERKRRTKLAFLLPIAAVLVGSTAWGAAGGRLPASVRAWVTGEPERTETLVRSTEKSAPLVRRAASPLAPPPEKAAAPPPAVAPVEPEAPAPSAAPAKSATPPDPSLELYRTAHQKHFAEQNPAAALAAWDAYLAAAPRGRFATEASYNRALCLVRLGRTAEARSALQPFAEGRFGGYRQKEASALVEALR